MRNSTWKRIGIASIFPISFLLFLIVSPHAQAADMYPSMSNLQQNTVRGTDYQMYTKNRGNSTVVMAPHGGGIEPASSEITREVANYGNYGYYTFMGIRPTNNRELHVTSANYDEPIAQNMVRASNRTVAFHKTANTGYDIYLGGRDQTLRRNIEDALETRGFSVVPAYGSIEGNNPRNIVNSNQQGAGVQLEMSNQLVQRFFKNGDVSRLSRENRANYTPTMYAFRDGVQEGLNNPRRFDPSIPGS